ncbi:MAG: DUF58 domain-containing protein [Myxococcales bacterium]|jgi:uncharacterized protein (DUF58 family)|nr:DUF58 domain-containing protein [Myxococcales bacterium]
MLPSELIKKLRKIEITTRKAVDETLAGQYHSVFKGRGMTFEEVRLYQPGDDIRTIDWNVTARLDEAYVKVFAEERELTVMLLVDMSASQDFGTRQKTKAELAAELAGLLAFSAISNNDRVGLILFSDRVERFVPPKKGRKHVMRLITDILTFEPEGLGTDVSLALETFLRVQKRRCVSFLISDFISDDFEDSLRICARRHDLIPVVLSDPFESGLPAGGIAVVENPETGERRRIDFSSSSVRRHFEKFVADRKDKRDRLFKKLSMDFVALQPEQDFVKPLVAFFRARSKRLAA